MNAINVLSVFVVLHCYFNCKLNIVQLLYHVSDLFTSTCTRIAKKFVRPLCTPILLALQVFTVIMDAAAISSICSGTFYENKILTKVYIFSDLSVVAAHHSVCYFFYMTGYITIRQNHWRI